MCVAPSTVRDMLVVRKKRQCVMAPYAHRISQIPVEWGVSFTMFLLALV